MLKMFERKRNQKNNYGLFPMDDLHQMAKEVCDGINGPGEYADRSAKFLVEIAMTETKGGTYWDKTKYAGMGITQIDKIGFTDTIKRTRARRKEQILDYFGVDLDTLDWVELRHNPRLCFLITRLFLMLRPGAIPVAEKERAAYWKRWYNTRAGKGTIAHFLKSNNYEVV